LTSNLTCEQAIGVPEIFWPTQLTDLFIG